MEDKRGGRGGKGRGEACKGGETCAGREELNVREGGREGRRGSREGEKRRGVVGGRDDGDEGKGEAAKLFHRTTNIHLDKFFTFHFNLVFINFRGATIAVKHTGITEPPPVL